MYYISLLFTLYINIIMFDAFIIKSLYAVLCKIYIYVCVLFLFFFNDIFIVEGFTPRLGFWVGVPESKTMTNPPKQYLTVLPMFSFVLSKENQQHVLTCSDFQQDNVPHKIHPSPIAQPSMLHYLLKSIFTLTTEGV